MNVVKNHLERYNKGERNVGVWECVTFILQFVKFTVLYPHYYFKGRSVILHDNSEITNKDHIDIIVVLYKGIYSYKNVAVFCSGVELLVNKLIKNRINYKLHLCYTRDDVKSIIVQEDNKKIWIFGHGRKYRLEYGDEFLYYEEMKDYPKKIYIKQVHCNPYGGLSLIDYLCPDPSLSFVSDGDVFAFENRKYIGDCEGKFLF
jgi:hypothetical protein